MNTLRRITIIVALSAAAALIAAPAASAKPGGDTAALRTTSAKYVDSVLSADYRQTCRLLSSNGQRNYQTAAAVFSGHPSVNMACPKAVAAVTAKFTSDSPNFRRTMQLLRRKLAAGKFSVQGNVATWREGRDPGMRFIKVKRRGWLVDNAFSTKANSLN
jgi:hypothetical protein